MSLRSIKCLDKHLHLSKTSGRTVGQYCQYRLKQRFNKTSIMKKIKGKHLKNKFHSTNSKV